jgi:hypothetical protein
MVLPTIRNYLPGSVNETSDMLQDWINDLSTSEEHLSGKQLR